MADSSPIYNIWYLLVRDTRFRELREENKFSTKKTIPMIFFSRHQCVRKFVYEDQKLFITELSEICSKGFNCASRRSESSIQTTQEILQKYTIVI
jgi:hypothetical protein